MDEKETSDSYEVGYGKPPRSTQFQRGVSGNPKGRPRKALDFDHELLRESRKSVILNENGQRRRIPKGAAVMKQLLNKAMSGNISAARTYLDLYRVACEKIALLEAEQARELERYNDLNQLSDEELLRLAQSWSERYKIGNETGAQISDTE